MAIVNSIYDRKVDARDRSARAANRAGLFFKGIFDAEPLFGPMISKIKTPTGAYKNRSDASDVAKFEGSSFVVGQTAKTVANAWFSGGKTLARDIPKLGKSISSVASGAKENISPDEMREQFAQNNIAASWGGMDIGGGSGDAGGGGGMGNMLGGMKGMFGKKGATEAPTEGLPADDVGGGGLDQAIGGFGGGGSFGGFGAKDGGGIKKGIISSSGTSGMTHGKGGPKDDAQPAKLDGGFVVPAEYVDRFFQSGAALKLGLSRTKQADQNQVGGSSVKLSPGEYYVDETKVRLAKSLGINLDEYAPNAKSKIKPGIKAADGTIAINKNDYWNTDSRFSAPPVDNLDLGNNEELPGSDITPNTLTEAKGPNLNGLYVKKKKDSSSASSGDDFAKKTSTMNDLLGLYNAGTNLGFLIHDLTKKFKEPSKQHIIKPDLYPTEIDTRSQEEDIKVAANTARTVNRNLGVDAATGEAGVYANTLDAISKLSQVKQNYRLQGIKENTSLLNTYRQNLSDSIFGNNMREYELRQQFEQNKANAIKGDLKGIGESGASWMQNRTALKSMEKGSSIYSQTIQGATLKFYQQYGDKLPYGTDQQKILDALIQSNFDYSKAAALLGVK